MKSFTRWILGTFIMLSVTSCFFWEMDEAVYSTAREAMNQNTSAERLKEIVMTKDPRLEDKMYGPDEKLGQNHKGLAVLRLIVQNPNVTEEILTLIAESKNEYVIGDVLAHPKTPKVILSKYSPGKNYLWDWGLSWNPNTSPEVLTKLADSDNEYTRSYVAKNPSAPQEVLRRLVRDSSWLVRRNIGLNPNIESELKKILSADEDERVRNAFKTQVSK